MDSKQLNEKNEDPVNDPVDRLLHEKKAASSGKGLAALALMLSLAAVGTTAWQWWQSRITDPDEATQRESMLRLQETQQGFSNSLTSVKAQLDALESPVSAADIARISKQIQGMETQLRGLRGQSGEDQASISSVQGSVRSLEQRLSTTESGLVTLAASSQNSSVELDIAEIDFLLRTASERLQLFSDPAAADLALQAADVQMEALNDPMFLSVRQRIVAARQALAMVPVIDTLQLSARLTSMQSKIAGLPFRGEADPLPEPELPLNAGWWESFKHTMSSLVTVRRQLPEEQNILSLEDKDYLRQGLWLQLESARLAIMRNDGPAYTGSLKRGEETIQQFFEKEATEVQGVLKGINTMAQLNIAPEMPDISEPWTQLRQLRDSRRLLQTATPVENEEAVE